MKAERVCRLVLPGTSGHTGSFGSNEARTQEACRAGTYFQVYKLV